MWVSETMFSKKQSVVAAANSTNTVAVPEEVGNGQPMYLEIMTDGYTGAGDMTVEVETSAAEDMTGGVVIVRYHVPNAKIVAGGPVLSAPLPSGCQRFLRLKYGITGSLTGGNLTAGLVLGTHTSL